MMTKRIIWYRRDGTPISFDEDGEREISRYVGTPNYCLVNRSVILFGMLTVITRWVGFDHRTLLGRKSEKNPLIFSTFIETKWDVIHKDYYSREQQARWNHTRYCNKFNSMYGLCRLIRYKVDKKIESLVWHTERLFKKKRNDN